MTDRVIYTLHIRVSGRNELTPDPKEIAAALMRGGYPVDGVVVESGIVEVYLGVPAHGQDEHDAAQQRWLKEQFDAIDAGTCPKGIGASA